MVVVLVACGWLLLVGGGGVFLGEVKARRKDIISFSLDYQKQKLSTDKQFIFKPQSTRHAGKAGGFGEVGGSFCVAGAVFGEVGG